MMTQEQLIKKYRINDLEKCIAEWENSIKEAVDHKMVNQNDYKNIVLRIASKTTLLFRGILTLCANGMPDAAMILARNLHEQNISLMFLDKMTNEPDFEQYIEEYYLNDDLQIAKKEVWVAEHFNQSPQEKQKATEYLNELKAKKRHKRSNEYFWTGKNNFKDLVEYLFQTETDEDARNMIASQHENYIIASVMLHSNGLGNKFRIGGERDYSIIDNTAKTTGIEIPLLFALRSVIFIVNDADYVLQISPNPTLKNLIEITKYLKQFEDQQSSTT